MSTVDDAFAAMRSALRAVDGVRLHVLGEEALGPDAVVLAPPRLTWGGPGPDPTDATFSLALVVAANDRAAVHLMRLLPRVVAAVEALDDAVVRRAEIGTYPASPTPLPAYLIDVGHAL